MTAKTLPTLMVGSTVELFSYDPTQVEALRNLQLLSTIYQTLVYKNSQQYWQPELASHWSVDKTQMQYGFQLNKSNFHDGTPVTCRDVVYSISRHLWPSSKSIMKAKLTKLIQGTHGLEEDQIPKGIINDEPSNSIIFLLTRPCPNFLELVSDPCLGITYQPKGDRKLFIGSGPLIPEITSKNGNMSFKCYKEYTGNRQVHPLNMTIYDNTRRVLN